MFPFARREVPLTARSSVRSSSRQAPSGAGRPPLRLEILEDRNLLATAISVANSSLISDAAGGSNNNAVVSADGRYVAYQSNAANILASESNPLNSSNIYLYDSALKTTTLVSHSISATTDSGAGSSFDPSISADGRFIAFESNATDLISGFAKGASNTGSDVFLYDRLMNTVALVSKQFGAVTTGGAGASDEAVISSNGNFIAYRSFATNLVNGQVQTLAGTSNVFVYSVTGNSNTLVSGKLASAANTGDGSSDSPAIDSTGHFIAFRSTAQTLTNGENNNGSLANIFVYNNSTAKLALVSHTSTSLSSVSNSDSDTPQINSDGSFIAFRSDSNNLVNNESNPSNLSAVYVYNNNSNPGTISLVSAASGSASNVASAGSFGPVITGNVAQTYVAYTSLASNLVAGEVLGSTSSDVYLFNTNAPVASQNTLVSRIPASPTMSGNNGSDSPVFSSDSSTILFRSFATNLVTGEMGSNGFGDLYEYTVSSGNVTLISHGTSAAVVTGDNASYTYPAPLTPGALPPGPLTAAPTNQTYPAYPSGTPLSGNGQVVAFSSFANNLTNGLNITNGADNVYLYSVPTLTATLVSQRDPSLPSVTAGGTSSTSTSSGASVSPDGRFVAFISNAVNLIAGEVESNNTANIYLLDRTNNTITLISHAATSSTTTANASSSAPSLAVNSSGQVVITYLSTASNLVAGETVTTAGQQNVYAALVTINSGGANTVTNTLVSHDNSSPTSTTTANAASLDPIVSGNGAVIVFVTPATNLVSGQSDTNNANDVFVYTVGPGTITLVSGAASSPTITGNAASDSPSISNDGNLIVFRSSASNLMSGENFVNNNSNVYLFNLSAATTTLISHISNDPTTTATGAADMPVISSDGTSIAFDSTGNNLVAGQVSTLGVRNVFLFDQLTNTTQLVSHVPGSSVTAVDGPSTNPVLSVDGSSVAYMSLADNLVNGQAQTSAVSNIYLYSRAADQNTLVSHSAASKTTTANGASSNPLITQDGRSVVYTSLANNLVGSELKNNSGTDVYGYDNLSGANTIVSANASSPLQTGDLPSSTPVISGNGTVVGFTSQANDLSAGDLNGFPDAFTFSFVRPPSAIALSNTTVPEFQPAGTTVGVFTTTDPNPGVTFTYSLVPGGADNGSFTIVGNTLQTAAVFNQATQSTFNILVQSTDSNGLSVQMPFTITVGFTPVAPTAIALSNNTLPENQPAGTVVGTFSSTDANPNDTFTYSLVGGTGSTDNSSFTIVGNQLETASVFTFAQQSSFSIRVQSTDASGLTFQQVFTINVTQIPVAPTAIMLSSTHIQDLSPANTAVGVFSTSSPNTGLTFTYTLVSGTGSTDNGSFNIVGSTLFTNNLSKSSRLTPYHILVQSTDSNGLSVQQAFTITVTPQPTNNTIGMFDPSTGTWYLRNELNAGAPDAGTFKYGSPGFKGFVGDWNGDGKPTVGVVDPSGFRDPVNAVWYLRNSNSAGGADIPAFIYGLRTWTPVVGDWTGSGVTGIGMFDPSTGTWYLRNTPNTGSPNFTPFQYGAPGWIPVVGDWNGDGVDTIGVVDPSTMTWYLRNSNTPGPADIIFQYGGVGWKPVVADWNASGISLPAVVDPKGNWYVRFSNSAGAPSFIPFAFGLGSWTPVAGDWDYPKVPQLAAGGEAANPTSVALTQSQLNGAVSAAILLLQADGVSQAVLSNIEAATYVTTNLPPGYLGLTSPTAHEVWIDSTAAGYGWFTNVSAAADQDFDANGVARPGTAAVGKMDLLTTVLHEMGHLAGLPDTARGNGLMAEYLPTGTRRVEALDAIFSSH